MKKMFRPACFFAAACASIFLSSWADAQGPNDVVFRLFDALKEGDVQAIQEIFGGDLLTKKGRLLTENSEYREFLRKMYQNAVFNIKHIEPVGQAGFLVYVEAVFENGNKTGSNILIQRETAGNWVISDEPTR